MTTMPADASLQKIKDAMQQLHIEGKKITRLKLSEISGLSAPIVDRYCDKYRSMLAYLQINDVVVFLRQKEIRITQDNVAKLTGLKHKHIIKHWDWENETQKEYKYRTFELWARSGISKPSNNADRIVDISISFR